MVEKLGARVLAVRCDISQAEEVKAALGETLQAFGGSSLVQY